MLAGELLRGGHGLGDAVGPAAPDTCGTCGAAAGIARAEEGPLTDERWAAIAADLVAQMDFDDRGDPGW